MQGRFNSFQKTMLHWNSLYPYSAIHAVRIPGALDEPRVRKAIQTVLEHQGLTSLELDRKAGTYEYHGGPADPEVFALPPSPDPLAALSGEMERQLNTPFDSSGRFVPFRFFLIPAGDSCLLALVYFHPVADAESIVRLLHAICASYQGSGEPVFKTPLNLYPDSSAHLLSRHPGVLLRRLQSLPRQVKNVRRWNRPPCRKTGDFANRLSVLTVEPGQLHALRNTAAAWDVTVNDLFLTLLLKSLSPMATGRFRARRRQQLGVGCIVNTRRDLGVDSRQTFGLFLGSFSVTHPVPTGVPLRDLALDVRQQTHFQKRHRLYLGTPLELGLARVALRFFSPERKGTFYLNHHPLWGGITNMNLNPLWKASAGDAPLDYFRAVSTGPITPLVLSVTTVREHANLSLSYRPAVFTDTQINQLRSELMTSLEEMRAAPPA